jgi:hypothetical protein
MAGSNIAQRYSVAGRCGSCTLIAMQIGMRSSAFAANKVSLCSLIGDNIVVFSAPFAITRLNAG